MADNKSFFSEPIRVIATSPVVKIGAQTMHELCIQLKENPIVKKNEQTGNSEKVEFEAFELQDIESAFEQIELVSYGEIKKVLIGETAIILKAFASGNSVGGTIWHVEYNKQ